ncbi:hypothetical protein DBV23_07985 [Edwardsiella ictaluri]|nr:hypothetical protein DBV23_07985 [Edwardsiella ictaluri]
MQDHNYACSYTPSKKRDVNNAQVGYFPPTLSPKAGKKNNSQPANFRYFISILRACCDSGTIRSKSINNSPFSSRASLI